MCYKAPYMYVESNIDENRCVYIAAIELFGYHVKRSMLLVFRRRQRLVHNRLPLTFLSDKTHPPYSAVFL